MRRGSTASIGGPLTKRATHGVVSAAGSAAAGMSPAAISMRPLCGTTREHASGSAPTSRNGRPRDPTRMSAIVPVCGEPAAMWAYLVRLCAYLETYTSQYQVIVVDDGSAPAAGHAASGFARENSRVRVLQPGAPSIEDAVRSGVLLASGDLLLVVGPDLCTPPEAFEHLLDAAPGADLILGSRAVASSPCARLCRRMLHARARNLGLRGIEDPAAGIRLMRREVAQDVYRKVAGR